MCSINLPHLANLDQPLVNRTPPRRRPHDSVGRGGWVNSPVHKQDRRDRLARRSPRLGEEVNSVVRHRPLLGRESGSHRSSCYGLFGVQGRRLGDRRGLNRFKSKPEPEDQTSLTACAQPRWAPQRTAGQRMAQRGDETEAGATTHQSKGRDRTSHVSACLAVEPTV